VRHRPAQPHASARAAPGAPAQFPHRDQDMWRGPTGEFEYLVNVMWPISPFKAENGATLVWPGATMAGRVTTARSRSPSKPIRDRRSYFWDRPSMAPARSFKRGAPRHHRQLLPRLAEAL
jgi:hypothetical protein